MAHGVCKKIAVQFPQLNVKAKITSKFAKHHSPFAKFVCQKKLLNLRAQKSREKMLMKLTPGESLAKLWFEQKLLRPQFRNHLLGKFL